jgi:hypothetical protein
MIDPADIVTHSLPVTAPMPMHLVIDTQQQTIQATLSQDLLGDWFITQQVTGKSTSGRLQNNSRRQSKMVKNQEEGFAILDALAKTHEKAGGKIRSSLLQDDSSLAA